MQHDLAASIVEDDPLALTEQIERTAAETRIRYGLYIDADTILLMLDDPEVVHFPTSLRFEAGPLRPRELARPLALGDRPIEGFCLFVHPHFRAQRKHLPLLIAYHIPTINYGTVIEPEHAVRYGSTLLGLDAEAYHATLGQLVDSIPDGRPRARGRSVARQEAASCHWTSGPSRATSWSSRLRAG